ncbi:hypothetical protein VPHK567_0197 [Vibrio phage K567]|nr:hypothetical protein MYOV011v1_p0017 [Vibrio phage 6E35.1a]
MKIIFLDIDGVLNNALDADEHKDVELRGEYQGFYSPRCVLLLNEIVQKTNAKIVLSSTWRHGLTIDDVNELFTNMNIHAECVGITRDFSEHKWSFRGNEIIDYIQRHKDDQCSSEFVYRDYVILDDDTDMLLWQKNNYINCDPEIGLTDRTVSKAIAVLNNSICTDTGQEFA